MNITWEGILMLLLMAVILVFVVLALSNFFKPLGSLNSYTQFVSLAGGACTSPQSATNLQFNSPNAVVFQIYDNSTCDSLLNKYANTTFSPDYPYSSSLANNFDLCYAVPGPLLKNNNIVSSGRQYYLNSSLGVLNKYYLTPILGTYNSANVVLGSYSAELGMPAVYVTANSSDVKDTGIEYHALNSSNPISFKPDTYSFTFNIYSNISAGVEITFMTNGGTCQPISEELSGGYVKQFSLSPVCNGPFQNVTLVINTVGKAISYEVNISAIQYSSYGVDSSVGVLSRQCMEINQSMQAGILENQSLVCEPITCGSTSFQLANAVNKPFVGLISGTYSYFTVQSGMSSLQIVNNNNEYLTNDTVLNLLLKSSPSYIPTVGSGGP